MHVGSQRGWNGEPESQRQRTIAKHLEKEDLEHQRRGALVSIEKEAEAEDNPSEDLKLPPTLSQEAESSSTRRAAPTKREMQELYSNFKTQQEIERVLIDDYIKDGQKETYDAMMERRWDPNKIKADAVEAREDEETKRSRHEERLKIRREIEEERRRRREREEEAQTKGGGEGGRG